MTSGYKVYWSDNAKLELLEVIKFLEIHWSEKALKKFFNELDNTILLISKNPELFQHSQSTHKMVRRAIILKHTKLYYKFESDEVTILSLFDGRQDPLKLKL